MGIVIKGGRVVTAVDDYFADVRIEGEKIVAIGKGIEKAEDQIIEAMGYYIMPGGIDTHTHFDLDVGSTVTADDFASGTRAAVIGGTTTILDYATQNKEQSLKKALEQQHNKAKGVCYCDYGFHMGITDWNDSVSEEMEHMVKEGVTSFKLYMAYKKTLQVDDGVIFKALKRSKEVNGLIGFHCENGDVIEDLVNEAKKNSYKSPYYHATTRPALAEKEAITRVLQLAEISDSPVYIVHLSSGEGLKSILEAKKRGVKVYVETCPQYLLLEDSLYGAKDSEGFEGAKYVMSPPLRKKQDQEELWKGIITREIDTIGTDHCSFNFNGQKSLGIDDFSKIPNGAPGVENRMALIYTYGVRKGKITLNDMVRLTSTNAAKLFGLFPQKGTIAVGSDADIVIWNPDFSTKITAEKQTQRVDYTPYEGFEQMGRAEQVFLRGNKLIKDGQFNINEPLGKFLKRITYNGGSNNA